jgi:hypothetical protein
MMMRTLLLVSALAAVATPILAQDAATLHDVQLLGAVAAATETRDADRLLELMIEVRARGLLMFAADGQTCEPVIPKTGLLATLTPRGTAQWAYVTQSRMTAMEAGNCGCPFALLSFDDFTRDLTGAVAPDLTQGDLATLQGFRVQNDAPVAEKWRAFRHYVCGE